MFVISEVYVLSFKNAWNVFQFGLMSWKAHLRSSHPTPEVMNCHKYVNIYGWYFFISVFYLVGFFSFYKLMFFL